MKINIYLLFYACLVLSVTNATVGSFPDNKRLLLQGCIKVDHENEKVPEIRILFNGMEAKSNREGLFAFPIKEQYDTYRLIICKNLAQNFETANTIDTISLPAGTLSKTLILNCGDNQDGLLSCASENNNTEKTNEPTSCKLNTVKGGTFTARNTIILLLDPDLVDRVEPWTVKLAENYVTLPRIILKPATKESLHNASAQSLLSALDYRPFHEQITGKKQKVAKRKAKLAIIP